MGRDRSSARERALAHMKRLLTAGAAGGAAVIAVESSAACVQDPLPQPFECPLDAENAFQVQGLRMSAYWDPQFRVECHVSGTADPADNRWIRLASDPLVVGAAVASMEKTQHGFHFFLDPGESAEAVIDIAIDCKGVPQVARYRIDLTTRRLVGLELPVALTLSSPVDGGN